MQPGEVLIVEGDHRISLKEIPDAIRDTGDEVVSIEDNTDRWIIKIRKVK
jgi:TusA-related sulfurtransferase